MTARCCWRKAYANAGRNAEAIAWLVDAAADDPDRIRRSRLTSGSGAGERQRLRPGQNAPRSTELKTQYVAAENAGGRDSLSRARDVLRKRWRRRPTILARCSNSQAEAARRLRRRRTDRVQDHRAERPQPDGLLRADDARRASLVPGGCRRAAPAVVEFRFSSGGIRRLTSASFSRTWGLPSELGDFEKAIAAFDKRIGWRHRHLDHRVSRPGAPVGQEVHNRSRDRAEGAHRARRRLAVRASRSAGAPPDRQGRGSGHPAAGVHQEAGGSAGAVRGAGAALLRDQTRRRRSAGAAGSAVEVPCRYDDPLRAGRDARQAEAVRRRRVGVPSGALERSRQRAGAELSRLHAGRPRRAARRVGRPAEEGARVEPDNGSYLGNLGWATTADKLDLAVTNLQRAAEQPATR